MGKLLTLLRNRGVLTQLPARAVPTGASECHVFMLKAVGVGKRKSKSYKRYPKTFVFRDVHLGIVRGNQVSDDIVRDFDVGYFEGSTVLSIRTEHDLMEIWQELKKGAKVIL